MKCWKRESWARKCSSGEQVVPQSSWLECDLWVLLANWPARAPSLSYWGTGLWQVWQQCNILDFAISSQAGEVLYSIVPVSIIVQQTLAFSRCYVGLCVTANIHLQGNIPKSAWSTWPACVASTMPAGNESLLSNVFIAWSLLDELIWFLTCLNEVLLVLLCLVLLRLNKAVKLLVQ